MRNGKTCNQCHRNWCPCFFCFRPQSFFHCASASVTGGSNLTTAPPLRRPPVLIARARQTLTYGELGRASLPRDGLFSAGEHRGGFSPSFDIFRGQIWQNGTFPEMQFSKKDSAIRFILPSFNRFISVPFTRFAYQYAVKNLLLDLLIRPVRLLVSSTLLSAESPPGLLSLSACLVKVSLRLALHQFVYR